MEHGGLARCAADCIHTGPRTAETGRIALGAAQPKGEQPKAAGDPCQRSVESRRLAPASPRWPGVWRRWNGSSQPMPCIGKTPEQKRKKNYLKERSHTTSGVAYPWGVPCGKATISRRAYRSRSPVNPGLRTIGGVARGSDSTNRMKGIQKNRVRAGGADGSLVAQARLRERGRRVGVATDAGGYPGRYRDIPLVSRQGAAGASSGRQDRSRSADRSHPVGRDVETPGMRGKEGSGLGGITPWQGL